MIGEQLQPGKDFNPRQTEACNDERKEKKINNKKKSCLGANFLADLSSRAGFPFTRLGSLQRRLGGAKFHGKARLKTPASDNSL